jgi:phosphopantetheine--protein transferase-like protein
MENKIKKIVSLYIKVPADQITANTVVDRSAVASSILLHRMYAALSAEGIVIENYWDIKNFGNLLQQVKGDHIRSFEVISDNTIEYILPAFENQSSAAGIGIDMEEIKSLPLVNDFREDEFYKMNFTEQEISYCILQADSIASFAGLFAAKEAIVKADNNYLHKTFNSIFIDHLPNGKPYHPSFQLSISHTNELAIAVAMANSVPSGKRPPGEVILSSSKNSSSISLVISLVTLLLVIVFICITIKRMSQ